MKTLNSIFPVLRYDAYPSLNPNMDLGEYHDYGHLFDWWAQDEIPLGLVQITHRNTRKKNLFVINVYENDHTIIQGMDRCMESAREHRRVATTQNRDYINFYIGYNHMLKEDARREGEIWGMPELTVEQIKEIAENTGHEHEFEDGFCQNEDCGQEDPDWNWEENCEHEFDEEDAACLNCGYER